MVIIDSGDAASAIRSNVLSYFTYVHPVSSCLATKADAGETGPLSDVL